MPNLEWNDISDWDSSQSSSGINHNNDPYTDSDPGKIKQGYQKQWPPLTHGLVGWWPLHTDKPVDLSGNNNHGTKNGGVTTGIAGKAGLQAMSLDGSDDYIDFGNVTFSGDKATWSLWLKTTDSGTSSVFGKNLGDPNRSYFLRIGRNNSGKLTFFGSSDGSNHTEVNGSTRVDDGNWHHIVVVFDGQNTELTIYVDGEVDVSETGFYSTLNTNSEELYIGANSGGSAFLDGKVVGFRHYSRVLTESEIQTLYEWGSSDQASPPTDGIARYALDGDATDSWDNNIVVDDYEDGDIAEYNIHHGNASISSSPTPTSGSNALKLDTGGGNVADIADTDELNHPQPGDIFKVRTYLPDTTGQHCRVGWAIQDESWSQGYTANINTADNALRLQRSGHGLSNHTISGTNVSWSNYTGEWLEIVIDWKTNGSMTVTVYDSSGSQIAQTSGSDSNLSIGGVGYQIAGTSNMIRYFDNYHILGGNDGTANGGVSWVEGVRGQAASFDGADDYIEFPATAQTEATFTAWVKPQSSNAPVFQNRYNGSWSNGYLFGISGSQEAIFNIEDSSGSIHEITSRALAQNEWHFITARYDGSKVVLYVNGEQEASISVPDLGESSKNVWMGRDGQHRPIIVDDARIYDYALTTQQIQEIYRYGTKGINMNKYTVMQ